jgi:hypothetical protein
MRLRNTLEDAARRLGFLFELGEQGVDDLHGILLLGGRFGSFANPRMQRCPPDASGVR